MSFDYNYPKYEIEINEFGVIIITVYKYNKETIPHIKSEKIYVSKDTLCNILFKERESVWNSWNKEMGYVD